LRRITVIALSKERGFCQLNYAPKAIFDLHTFLGFQLDLLSSFENQLIQNMQIPIKSNIPQIISGIAATIISTLILWLFLPSFWFWMSSEIFAALLVAAGCSGEWWLHHHPAGKKKSEKNEHHKIESRFIAMVSIGVIMEFFVLGHSIRESVILENKVSEARDRAAQLEKEAQSFRVKADALELQIEQNDPMNQPINDLSAEVRFIIKGDRHTHLSSETEGWSGWLTFCMGNDISNKVFFLNSDSADITVANILGGDTDRECDMKFRKPVSSLIFPEYPGWGTPAKNFDKIASLILQVRGLETNNSFTVLRGDVDVVINGQIKRRFDIPQQNERFGCISSQKTITNGTNRWSVLPVNLIDMSGQPVGRYDGK
jgi:hypothetical protein